MLRDATGRILLARRLTDHEHGKYGMPGGKVDYGEHPVDTAFRELLEETGIGHTEIKGYWVLPLITSNVYPGEKRHYVCIWIEMQIKEPRDIDFIELDAKGKPKNEKWTWVPEAEALKLPTMQFYEEALEYANTITGISPRVLHDNG